MYKRIDGEKLTIRDNCYCGSRTTLKKCTEGNHDKAYRNFKKIEKIIISRFESSSLSILKKCRSYKIDIPREIYILPNLSSNKSLYLIFISLLKNELSIISIILD